jgi:dihydroneopterin aldolase
MTELFINGIEVDCVIGERPDERCRNQRLLVDVVLAVDTKADETDELGDTVDYASLADRIRSMLVAAKCKMIERAARLAYELCRSERGVVSAKVTVTKSGAVPGLRSASARIGD